MTNLPDAQLRRARQKAKRALRWRPEGVGGQGLQERGLSLRKSAKKSIITPGSRYNFKTLWYKNFQNAKSWCAAAPSRTKSEESAAVARAPSPEPFANHAFTRIRSSSYIHIDEGFQAIHISIYVYMYICIYLYIYIYMREERLRPQSPSPTTPSPASGFRV